MRQLGTGLWFSLLGVGDGLEEFDFDVEGRAVANDGNGDDIAHMLVSDGADPGVFALDLFAVDGNDEVATDAEFDVADVHHLRGSVNACSFFRGAAEHVLHEQAAAAWEAQSFGEISGH